MLLLKRLETVSPSLAEKLARASVAQRQSLVLVACELAVKRAGLDNPQINAALAAMRQQHPATAEQVAAITALAELLDEQYFALQEEADEGRASAADYLGPFSQARAASAVVYALKDDSLDASMEAVYEVTAATDVPEETARTLESLLT